MEPFIVAGAITGLVFAVMVGLVGFTVFVNYCDIKLTAMRKREGLE